MARGPTNTQQAAPVPTRVPPPLKSPPPAGWDTKVLLLVLDDEKALNDYSAAGWELVGVVPVAGSNKGLFYLKRPMAP